MKVSYLWMYVDLHVPCCVKSRRSLGVPSGTWVCHPEVMQMLANFRTPCHTHRVAKPHFHLHTPGQTPCLTPRVLLRHPALPRASRTCIFTGFYVTRNCFHYSQETRLLFPFKIRSSDVPLLYLPALETGSVTVALFQLPSHRALEKHTGFARPPPRLSRNMAFVRSACAVIPDRN